MPHMSRNMLATVDMDLPQIIKQFVLLFARELEWGDMGAIAFRIKCHKYAFPTRRSVIAALRAV